MIAHKRYTVFPGQFIITSVPALISTVLGSCVSVCLWDKETKIGGMNHYLLPGTLEDSAGNPNRGITSIRLLYKSMLNRNVKPGNLEAKVFGGCNSMYRDNDVYKVGERNIAVAMDLLNELGVTVVAHNTGGEYGRKIVFNTANGKVRMRLLKRSTIEINEEINKGFGY
jgi:chemotaxis protein CheD